MMKINYLPFLAGCAIILVLAGAAIAADKPPVTPVKVKPDITISDLSITRLSATPTSDNIRISATSINRVRGTSTGPFKIKVEWTEDPTVGWNLLGTSGIANLFNDPAAAAVRGETRTFDHAVPKGKAYKYRVTADYMGQVDESNEANNVNSAGYIAR